MRKSTKLEPIYGSVKSYYGKANVIEEDNYKMLFSYDTFICELKDDNINAFSDDLGHYTQTTMRHLNEFLQQNNIGKFTKKEWLNYMANHIAKPMN